MMVTPQQDFLITASFRLMLLIVDSFGPLLLPNDVKRSTSLGRSKISILVSKEMPFVFSLEFIEFDIFLNALNLILSYRFKLFCVAQAACIITRPVIFKTNIYIYLYTYVYVYEYMYKQLSWHENKLKGKFPNYFINNGIKINGIKITVNICICNYLSN